MPKTDWRDQRIAELEQEIAELQKQLNQIRSRINLTYIMGLQDAWGLKHLVDYYFQRLDEAHQEGGTKPFSDTIGFIYQQAEDQFLKPLLRRHGWQVLTRPDDLDIYKAFLDTIRINQLVALRYAQLCANIKAYELAGDPRLLCYQIQLECRIGDPALHTVKKLSLDWVKINIDERIGSPETLYAGLQVAARERHEIAAATQQGISLTRDTWAKQNGHTSRAVRNYRRWLRKIEDQARAPGSSDDWFRKGLFV